MRFGAHVYVWTDTWSDDTLGVLDRAAALGLDYVELTVGDDITFTPEATRFRAQQLGLELTVSPGGLWPVECDLSSPDPEHRRLGLDWHKRVVDLAGEVGATAYTGACYGHPGVIRTDTPPEACYPAAAEGLHALAEYAAKAGVAIVLEPMSRFRTHVLNNPAQAVRLLKMADHPNLSALMDTYHMVTEVRDYGEAARTYGDRLWGLHACENDRGRPGGGLVQWDRLADALVKIGFDGYVALETYNTSIPGFALSRRIFQDLCPDGDAFVRDGVAFLRDCLARASKRAAADG